MRLSVLKIVWGMFAFPWIYRGEFARALSLPLLVILGSTIAGSFSDANATELRWLIYSIYLLAFSWLALRCHRFALLGSATASPEGDSLPRTLLVFATTVIAVWIVQTTITLTLTSLTLTLSGSLLIPHATPPPPPDPAIQTIIDRIAFLASIPGMYLLARLGPLFPTIAIGRPWRPGDAFRMTRGNGWRIVCAVLLIPQLFKMFIQWVYSLNAGAVAMCIGVLLVATVSALGVIAMSLTYRELTAAPSPPPTTPPA